MSSLEFHHPSIANAGAELGHVGLTAADVHALPMLSSGATEAHALSSAIVPGAEHGLMAPLVPGAGEPISPLIQLIMRMPGQIGLLHSFFECLGNFFMPYLHNLLPAFDPSMIAMHAQSAHMSHAFSISPHGAATAFRLPGGEHLPVDISLIPKDAPIFHGPFNDGSGFIVGDKLNLGHSELLSAKSAMNVNNGLDLNNPQFEGAAGGGGIGQPGQLSGPSMSDGPVGTHLVGTQRLFSDRIQGTFFNKPGTGSALASATGNTTGLSQTVPLSGTPAYNSQALASNSLSSTNTLAQAPAAQPGAEVGNGGLDTNTLGSSGQTTLADHLGAASGQKTVAWNTGSDAFRPTLGQSGTDYGASYLRSQPAPDTTSSASHPSTGAGHTAPTGLKAKELSLDSKPASHSFERKTAHASGHTMDQVSHRDAHRVAYDTDGGHADAVDPHQAVSHGSHAASAGHTVAKSAAKAVEHKVAHTAKPAEPKAAEAKAGTAAPKNTQEAQDGATTGDTTKLADNAAATGGGGGAISDAQTGSYTIRAGDCLWNIAKDKLGSGLKWEEIYNANKDVLGSNPDMIYSGTTIKLPGGEIASAGADASKYVVKSGDCLWNIAKNQLHDATKWNDLYKANADMIGSNPRLIMPGQQLNMPGDHAQMVADSSGVSAHASGAMGSGQATPSAGDQAVQATAGAAQPQGLAAQGAPGADASTMSAPGAPSIDATGGAPTAAPASELQPALQQTIPTLQNSVPMTPTTTPALGGHASLPPTGSTPALSMGPGAAGAATLHTLPLNIATVPTDLAGASFKPTVVSSNFSADLAALLSKKK